MGQKFLLTSKRPCFLSIGCTKRYFQSLVKYPVSKGMLTILVITGSISSRHTVRRDAGIGSRGKDFLFAKAGLRQPPQTTAKLWIPHHRFQISVTGFPIPCQWKLYY